MQGTKLNRKTPTLSLDEVIRRYALSNQAENKSPATVNLVQRHVAILLRLPEENSGQLQTE